MGSDKAKALELLRPALHTFRRLNDQAGLEMAEEVRGRAEAKAVAAIQAPEAAEAPQAPQQAVAKPKRHGLLKEFIKILNDFPLIFH